MTASKCAFPTDTDIDSMFARQTPLNLWFCVFHPPGAHSEVHESLRHCPSGLYFHEPLYLTFPSSMRVMTSASLCPSDQPTKNLGCLSSLILFLTRIRSKNPATLLRCFVSCVCFMWRNFDGSTATQIYVALHQKVLDSFGMSHCPLRNRMVEYDLSTSTSCILNHDLQPLSQRSHALLSSSVRLTLFVTLVGIPSLLAVLCTASRKHSSWSQYTGLFPYRVRNTFRNCSRSSNFCSRSMNGWRKRFSTRSSTNQDLDFCTLLTVLHYCVEVGSFRNCLSRMG